MILGVQSAGLEGFMQDKYLKIHIVKCIIHLETKDSNISL